MAPFPSEAIDPTKARVPKLESSLSDATSPYFISLRVRTCESSAGNVIPDAIRHTIESCTTPGSKAGKHALYRHTNPFGNLYAMMFSLSEQDRLEVAVKLIEFLSILDDVMEELPYEQAIREHEILCQALDRSPTSGSVVIDDYEKSECLDGIKKFLNQIRDTVLSLDDLQGDLLLADLQRTLRHRECAPAIFASLEEYLPYRVVNLDWYFVCLLLRWSMNVDLPDSEVRLESLNNFEYIVGAIGGMANDYFSWNKEKHQYSDSDRIMNAVPVLMRQYSVSETRAKLLLHDIIIQEANHVEQLLRKLEEDETSEELKRYVAALEYIAGGYTYWCSTCPRYYTY